MNGKEIGKIIKNKREEKQWSQNDLAKLMSVTPQAVSAWEVGKSIPTFNAISKLANLFNCSKYELMGEEIQQMVKDVDVYPRDKYNVTMPNERVIVASQIEPSTKGSSAKAFEYATKLSVLDDADKEVIYNMIDALLRRYQ